MQWHALSKTDMQDKQPFLRIRRGVTRHEGSLPMVPQNKPAYGTLSVIGGK
jgi:hypothetical protein